VIAAALLGIVLIARRLPGVDGIVAQIWAGLSAGTALVAAVVAFSGPVRAAALLVLALTVAIAGRSSALARWISATFTTVGGMLYLVAAPPTHLFTGTAVPAGSAAATLGCSVLLVAVTVVLLRTAPRGGDLDETVFGLLLSVAAVVVLYATTMFMVTAGVLIGGVDGGFLGGQMAATICWVLMAAALFALALRTRQGTRTALIIGGLTLTAAAMAKLFLFDLGTLSGIFRVAVFIVAGLLLLAMGAGYARSLARQDASHPQS